LRCRGPVCSCYSPISTATRVAGQTLFAGIKKLIDEIGLDLDIARLITPKISQEMLVARVGTTRFRINYFMNKFRRLDLIEYNGEVRVHTALINVIVHD
jgi:hypothetical protein